MLRGGKLQNAAPVVGYAVARQAQDATILIVGFSQTRRDSVARFLEWELPKARILVAPNEATAIRLASREDVDLVILDVAGGESYEELDARATTRIPARLYLADDSRGLIDSASMGPRAPDARPLDFRKLLDQVRRALQRRRS